MIWQLEEGAPTRLSHLGVQLVGAAAAIGSLAAMRVGVHPQEADQIVGAVPIRRHEFAAGRHLARRAMAVLGLPEATIGRRQDRSPDWPAGICGSISHCRHLAVAVVCARPCAIGIDVECTGRLEARLFPSLFTDSEARLAETGDPAATLLFSAKEAIFKAVYPLTGLRPTFQDAEVMLDSDLRRFKVRRLGGDPRNGVMEAIDGYCATSPGHVLTLAVIEP